MTIEFILLTFVAVIMTLLWCWEQGRRLELMKENKRLRQKIETLENKQ